MLFPDEQKPLPPQHHWTRFVGITIVCAGIIAFIAFTIASDIPLPH